MVLFLAATAHAGSDTKNRTATAGHTPSEGWSKDSMFDVRWGMGPADVKAKHPHLSKVHKELEPIFEAVVTERVEGLLIFFVFRFYQGRLVSFSLGPRHTLRQDAPKEEEDQFELMCRIWGRRVRDILREKYGEPLPANSSFIGTKWRTTETIVGLSFVESNPFLVYEDAARSEDVRAAVDAYQRARKAEIDEESRRRF